eukprot:Skav215622  [mRNA]  locus=scaffold5106:7718:11964:- [translate_table: standard]
MLAKVRASSIRLQKLASLLNKRCGSGSVMILGEEKTLANSATQGKSAKIRRPRLSGGIYVVPEEYSKLLEQLKSGRNVLMEQLKAPLGGASSFHEEGLEVSKGLEASASSESQEIHLDKTQKSSGEALSLSTGSELEDSRQFRRAFWAGVREVAKHRIKSKEPDLSPAEIRVAKLHESLWVEELRMTLELQGLKSRVDIKPRGNGLFTIDLSDMFDDFSYSLGQFLQRGVQVQISNGGESCLAFIQPSSDSGKLLVSSEKLEPLCEEGGPFDIEFLPNRFPQWAMHRALDCEREIVELADVPVSQAALNETALDVLRHLELTLNETALVEGSSRRLTGDVCWISRHKLWDCGLDCYHTSTYNWKPCASRCVQFQHLSANCNYCLSHLVSCVLLQCVAPCGRSTHNPSCEGCILGGAPPQNGQNPMFGTCRIARYKAATTSVGIPDLTAVRLIWQCIKECIASLKLRASDVAKMLH